jgi:transcriptional regulator with XRE-family HTH domain
MKKYSTLGELLMEYRRINMMSQIDLATLFDVDIRTILRWEKNETLLKPEKEKLLADITFIPYQVIRNLNAPVAIPTYYDFDLRKYSLSSISKDLPDADWIKDKIDKTTDRIRSINTDVDIDYIIRFTNLQNNNQKATSKELIRAASNMLPELNIIVSDTSGNYAGHCVYFPLSLETYEKIKKREIKEKQLNVGDLVNYKHQKTPVFYCHSITADCNENFFFIIGAVLKFFRDTPLKNYIYALLTSRYDSYDMSKQLGVKLIWEDKEAQEKQGMIAAPRLYEGNFSNFLK